jgi:hypothetical protein
VGESHGVRQIKGVETEDFMQARRSVRMPGGWIHGSYRLTNRMHGSGSPPLGRRQSGDSTLGPSAATHTHSIQRETRRTICPFPAYFIPWDNRSEGSYFLQKGPHFLLMAGYHPLQNPHTHSSDSRSRSNQVGEGVSPSRKP